ncbi:hypothetical protein EV197_3360 [Aquimarina brevivitae]|uniref:Uncharacterized protein n=1 Tax=Aquimarina brevivitae TaxID=323412 RepID=A0A4Q7NTQ3_9FLAO|nr:hypothetical protein EV197_3360 [Aquimarina brevivitae]
MEITTTNPTNYKKWSFRFIVYLVLLNCVTFYLAINFNSALHNFERFIRNMSIATVVSILILIAGIVFTILSIKNKESKNYQFYISVIGFSFFIILSLLFLGLASLGY